MLLPAPMEEEGISNIFIFLLLLNTGELPSMSSMLPMRAAAFFIPSVPSARSFFDSSRYLVALFCVHI